jgi:hypothetical protein
MVQSGDGKARTRAALPQCRSGLGSHVSTSEIISEIQKLAPSEQAEVIQFAYRLDVERMLSGKELAALAQRMVNATDPLQKLRIREELTRGFYGGKSNA